MQSRSLRPSIEAFWYHLDSQFSKIVEVIYVLLAFFDGCFFRIQDGANRIMIHMQ